MKLSTTKTVWILPVAIAGFLIWAFTSAGDGVYRYPCQDPSNWGTPECKPPVCEADGTCPRYLLDMDLIELEVLRENKKK